MTSFYLASQPKALAPNTAASLSFNSESITLTLPLYIANILRSIDSQIGFIIKSPDFANPPKRIIALGLEKATKSANASPKIVPV